MKRDYQILDYVRMLTESMTALADGLHYEQIAFRCKSKTPSEQIGELDEERATVSPEAWF